ncbi:MAG TPA: response regulator [Candidatus Didemnitutus sp.]|nr:response regulator [Candidatus Didemnitutus sp.]
MAHAQSSVVLLENDISLSQAMERVLQASGFHTRAFRNLASLMETQAAADAACLVVDVSAATEHGLGVREHLRVGRNTPIIFISGYDEPETRAQAHAAGAAVYLPKPFTGRALVEAIHRVLLGAAAGPAAAPA